MAQIVVTVPVETPAQTYRHLGGLEGLGKKGGYYNIEVHFPKLLSSPAIQRWLRKRSQQRRQSTSTVSRSSLTGPQTRSRFQPPSSFSPGPRHTPTGSRYKILSTSMLRERPRAT